jgi:protein phosphatase 1 regulatory subunit 7
MVTTYHTLDDCIKKSIRRCGADCDTLELNNEYQIRMTDSLGQLTNLTELRIIGSGVQKIRGMSGLVKLDTLILNSNKIKKVQNMPTTLTYVSLHGNYISEIGELIKLNNLAHLNISDNMLTHVREFKYLTNLKHLLLLNNNISSLHGLERLTKLESLLLSNNNISSLNKIAKLTNLVYLFGTNNKIADLSAVQYMTNLETLVLSINYIKNINPVSKLTNLKRLDLYRNRVEKIEGLEKLLNLQELNLELNKLVNINGLNTLTKLHTLYLSYNNITKIENISNLVNLRRLSIGDNKLTELPMELMQLPNLIDLFLFENEIDFIPLPVQRLLDRLEGFGDEEHGVYNDKQNVHNHVIQESFRQSLSNLLKDKILIDLENCLEIVPCTFKSNSEHSTLHVTEQDIYHYVMNRILLHDNREDLLKIFKQELQDGYNMCFTGRITRMVSALCGYCDDIHINISLNEQISNNYIKLKEQYDGDKLREKFKERLDELQVPPEAQQVWLAEI